MTKKLSQAEEKMCELTYKFIKDTDELLKELTPRKQYGTIMANIGIFIGYYDLDLQSVLDVFKYSQEVIKEQEELTKE